MGKSIEPEKIVFSWSSGKDSAMALSEILKSGKYEVVSLLTTVTRDYDRVSMHGVRHKLLEMQAESLQLPLEVFYISTGATNEEYERQMGEALARFQKRGVTAVAFGDIFLDDLRKYREDRLASIGMQGIFPLWKRNTKELIQDFVNQGFKAVITCVDSKTLGKEYAGRLIGGTFLEALPKGIDPAGENGEYHSFAFEGPIFRKKIKFNVGEVVLRDSFYFCDLIPA